MAWKDSRPPTPDEIMAKLSAEKASANYTNCAEPYSQHNAFSGQLQEQASLKPSLAHRIERQLQNAASDRDRYARALEILVRHPEFEELIELLNMHLV